MEVSSNFEIRLAAKNETIIFLSSRVIAFRPNFLLVRSSKEIYLRFAIWEKKNNWCKIRTRHFEHDNPKSVLPIVYVFRI